MTSSMDVGSIYLLNMDIFACFFLWDPVQQHHVSDGATEAVEKDVRQNKSAGHHNYDSECTKPIADFTVSLPVQPHSPSDF